MTKRRLIDRSGFTLIEMAIVIVIVGIVLSIVITVLPSLIKSAKVKKSQAILEKIDYALKGYVAANGRCPCPDTDGDGQEDRIAGSTPPADDTCSAYVGQVPYATIGLSDANDAWNNPVRYGVYRDMICTTVNGLCSAAPCSLCLTNFITNPDPNLVHTHDGTTASAQAWILASGGSQDSDGANGFFDGRNGSAPAEEFEAPTKITDPAYDDLVRATSFAYLNGSLCSGSGGGGGGGGTIVAENTYTNGCQNGIDDDGDGYIDCDDQDCYGVAPCSAGGSNVSIVTGSLPGGKVGDNYNATIQASGGVTPYQWALTANGGFSNLFLHTYTGQLSGKLIQCPGTHNITVTVTDATPAADGGPKTASKTFPITVTADLNVIRTSGTGTDIQWMTATQQESFEVSGGHVGDISWSLTTGGANGFEVAGTGSGSCVVRKNGETTTGPGPYTFVLTASDSSCSGNTAQLTFTVTIPASGSGAAAPYTVGMEAQWRFDECATWDGVNYDVIDSLGNSLHYGRIIGSVHGVHNGRICRAASFAGGDDRIVSDVLTGADIMSFSDQVSLACWFKSPGGGGVYPRLIEFSNSAGDYHWSTAIAYDTDGSLRAWVTSQAGVRGGQIDYSAETYNDNKWHHVVYTYSQAGGGRLYVDGALKQNRTDHPTGDIHDAETFVIGGYYPDGSHGYVGLIDEVMVFQRELTPDDVTELYQLTRPTCPGDCYSGPIAHYRMENAPWNGSPDEVLDSGSGGSNGRAAQRGSGSLPTQTDSSSGKVCRAGVFSRVDASNGGYLDIGDPSDGDLDPAGRNWTVAVWINWDGSSGENMIYNKENLYEARVVSGYVNYAMQPHWYWDGGTSFPVTAGTWTHVATVYDGNEQILYKDGQRVYSRPQTGAIGANSSRLLIGARGSTSPRNFFGGMIDELQIFDRALSQSEIKALTTETHSCN